jgi:UDP-N-acetylmuramyl pentapeptide phosphotransferase/UDP-N-acetylglucosamine-1-phosphate transferase
VLTGLGFLIGAGYIATARRLGDLETALIFAGGFVLVAVILVFAQRIWSKARARRIAERRKREVTGLASAAALALLPALLAKKGAVSAVAIPVIAAIAYAVWRENSASGSDASDKD